MRVWDLLVFGWKREGKNRKKNSRQKQKSYDSTDDMEMKEADLSIETKQNIHACMDAAVGSANVLKEGGMAEALFSTTVLLYT